jgi:chemotaxis signal transduction protein
VSSDHVTDADRAILRARAQRLAAPQAHDETESASSSLAVASFRIGGELFGVALASLRAVLPLRAVTPVPLAPPHVVGVLRFRGRIITALSLASMLGGRGLARDPSVLLVVDPGWNHLVAIDCEHIPQTVNVAAAAAADAARKNAGAVVDVDNLKLILIDRLLDRRTDKRDG